MTEFMGKSIDYWTELQRHVEAIGVPTVEEILDENAQLRKQLGHAERIIKDVRRVTGQFQ